MEEIPYLCEGEEIYVRVIAAQAGDGFAITFTDLTERYNAAKGLEREAERLRLVTAASGSLGSWDWDIVENKVTSDAYFASYFGLDAEQAAVGVPISEFIRGIHPEDRERVSDAIENAVETGAEYDIEYRVIGTGDRVRWVLAKGRSIRDEDGKPS